MNEIKGLDNGRTNYGDHDFSRFLRRSFARSMGSSNELLARPIVGIAMTPSGISNCHRTIDELVEADSRGVFAAGGLPIDILVPEDEVKHRLEAFPAPAMPKRGYHALYRRTVMQAPQGYDFNFLEGSEE